MCRFCLRSTLLAAVFAAIAFGPVGRTLQAQQDTQCFSLEFFYDSSVNSTDGLQTALQKFADERTGLLLHFRDVHGDDAVQQRIEEIAKHFKLPGMKLPAIYGLKNVIVDLQSENQLRNRLNEILRMTAYVRNGCPHCRDTKAFLQKYGSRYPALEIVYKEVTTDAANNREMQAVVSRYRQAAASLPVIHYCNGLTIGFDRETTTGRKILETLDYWSRACAGQKKS